jgi:hypothetical protein
LSYQAKTLDTDKGHKMNAENLQKWDVITFRRSNMNRSVTALIVSDIQQQTFADMTFTSAVVEINNKTQVLNFNEGVTWKLIGTMNPDKVGA